MKKYLVAYFLFFSFWTFLIGKTLIIPKLEIIETKKKFNMNDFYIYKYIDEEPIMPKKNKFIIQPIPILDPLTEQQSLIKKRIIQHLKNNWNKFIQYNDNNFCYVKTDLPTNDLKFIYCDSNLFQRSLELSKMNISSSDLFNDIIIDFTFEIKSYELKEKLSEENSFYVDAI